MLYVYKLNDILDRIMKSIGTRLGQNILSRRLELGWTQEFLAQQLSVEVETISRIERGVSAPSIKTVDRLANILNLSVSELFVDEKEPKKQNDLESLAALLTLIHPDDQKQVIASSEKWAKHFLKIRSNPDN